MKNLKNYFNLSSREYSATILIISLLILLAFTRLSIPYLEQNERVDLSGFKTEIKDFEATVYSDTVELDNNYVSNFSKESREYENEKTLFTFDPNSIDSSTFLELGLSPKQTKVICNFRRKGGLFYDKNSFKKMYCISSNMFEKLEPYISISSAPKKEFAQNRIDTNHVVIKPRQIFKEENVIVEINDADTTSLKRIRGIGSSFAKRIIAYREKLGGFIHKKQLMEVFGIDTTVFAILEKHIVIDSTNIKKINLNEVGFYTLKNFPYLKQSQVSALLNYRDKHGKFAKPSDIKKCVLIDEETYSKMRAYVKTTE